MRISDWSSDVCSSDLDDYGVRWLTTYSEGTPEEPKLPTFPPAARALRADEHPFPVERLWQYDTMYVEPGRYLRQMMREIEGAGGRIDRKSTRLNYSH